MWIVQNPLVDIFHLELWEDEDFVYVRKNGVIIATMLSYSSKENVQAVLDSLK